jgi:hypothetical protein
VTPRCTNCNDTGWLLVGRVPERCGECDMTDPTSYAAGIEAAAQVVEGWQKFFGSRDMSHVHEDMARAIRALAAAPPPPVPAQAESGEVCPIGMLPEHRSLCSNASCRHCLADRLANCSDRVRELEAKLAKLEGRSHD